MDEEIEQLAEELGVSDDREFGIPTPYAVSQGWDKGSPATVDQLQRMSDAIQHQLGSSRFSSDEELIEIAEKIEDDWPAVEVVFGGRLGVGGYVDAMFMLYDDVSAVDEFEEYIVLRFKSTMEGGESENKGIDPVSDERITLDRERFRHPREDDYLVVSTSELSFRDRDNYGKVVRLWWDD